jgi:hypothetical protein
MPWRVGSALPRVSGLTAMLYPCCIGLVKTCHGGRGASTHQCHFCPCLHTSGVCVGASRVHHGPAVVYCILTVYAVLMLPGLRRRRMYSYVAEGLQDAWAQAKLAADAAAASAVKAADSAARAAALQRQLQEIRAAGAVRRWGQLVQGECCKLACEDFPCFAPCWACSAGRTQ